MVSNDTSAGTISLLAENDNFGMDADQITIVQQGDGVPALLDNNAKIALVSEISTFIIFIASLEL